MAMLTRKLGPAPPQAAPGLSNRPTTRRFPLSRCWRWRKAGVPDGVLNGVAGDTHAISDAIMASGAVRKISFTGSTAVGKTLMRNAAETMKNLDGAGRQRALHRI